MEEYSLTFGFDLHHFYLVISESIRSSASWWSASSTIQEYSQFSLEIAKYSYILSIAISITFILNKKTLQCQVFGSQL